METLSLSSDRRRAIQELIRGRESALQLRNIIRKPTKSDGSQVIINQQQLVANILSSFTNSLSILNNGGDSGEVSRSEARAQLSCSPSWEDYLKPEEDSGESGKSSKIEHRGGGCYNNKRRRKRAVSWTTRHSSTLIDDAYAWRKYGQKVILNAKFPRNYFRCTHKLDQGCQATKDVQRIEEEPPVYRTTYYGHHTCTNLLNSSQILLDSTVVTASDDDRSSMMISLGGGGGGGTQITDKDTNPFFSSLPSLKQQVVESSKDIQAPSDMTLTHKNQSSSSSSSDNNDDYLMSLESGGGLMMTMLSSDHGDVVSGVNPSSAAIAHHSFDLSVDFDDVFAFEF